VNSSLIFQLRFLCHRILALTRATIGDYSPARLPSRMTRLEPSRASRDWADSPISPAQASLAVVTTALSG